MSTKNGNGANSRTTSTNGSTNATLDPASLLQALYAESGDYAVERTLAARLSNPQHAHGLLDRMESLDRLHVERQNEMEMRSTYASGETSRMNPVPRGIDPLGSDADYHYRLERNYFLHVERGRAAVRNHPLVEQGINRLIANLRLDQVTLDPNTGDPELDRDIKQKWMGYTGETIAGRNLCDYEGTRTLNQINRQSFFNRITDGDIIHLPLETNQIQTWESHHIRSPFGAQARLVPSIQSDQDGFVHGAEIRKGRVTRYWITPLNLTAAQSLSRNAKVQPFPVFDGQGNKVTFWIGFRHRFFQRRGISRLSAPRDAMTGFEDLNYSNIKSSLRRALISYLMEQIDPSNMPKKLGKGQGIPRGGERYEETQPGGLDVQTVEVMGEPAQALRAPDGYAIKGWNANMPVSNWFEHASTLLTMLSVNIDLPLSFFLLDGAKVNFHGGRMIWDQVKLRLEQLQRDEISEFWAPTFEWWMRRKLDPKSSSFDRAIAAAANRDEIDVFSYRFRPKGWPYVKPLEDVKAESIAETGNLKSMKSILSDRGVDEDDHQDEIITGRATMITKSITAAREIVKENADLELDIVEIAKELRTGQPQEAAMGEELEEKETSETENSNSSRESE